MFPVRDLNFVPKLKLPELAEDNSNISLFFAVDVAGNSATPKNYGGWPRNDLAQINAQKDMSVAKAMALQLHTSEDIDFNAGKTDAEIMLHAKSKYIQSPSEMTRYIEQELAFRDEALARAQQIKAEAQKVAARKHEIDELRDSLTPEEREEVRVAKRKKQVNKLV